MLEAPTAVRGSGRRQQILPTHVWDFPRDQADDAVCHIGSLGTMTCGLQLHLHFSLAVLGGGRALTRVARHDGRYTESKAVKNVRPPVAAVMSAPASWAVKDTGSKRIQDQSLRADGMPDAPSRLDRIELIAMDIDGTLLDSQHHMSDRAESALKLAMAQGVQVMVATGKSRGPWVPGVFSRLKGMGPAVFMQGLQIYSPAGELVFERQMDADVATQAIQVAVQEGLTHVAYCGTRILCSSTDAHTDRLIGYGEPIPEAVGPLVKILETTRINKILLMSTDEILAELRPRLEAILGDKASLVTSVTGMLEVLPPGQSKGGGVAWVLERLGVEAKNVMAIGDGENDIEMLEMAGWSVAMGNAGSKVKEVAQFHTGSNDKDGLAEAVERLVLNPGYWCWD